MKSRCLNPKVPQYPRYGGRGISICPEWLDSFPTFFRDMGPCPDGFTLERKDNDAGYFPANCEWASWAVQQVNKEWVRKIEHDGIIDSAGGWERRTGIGKATIKYRLKRGWTAADALTKPPDQVAYIRAYQASPEGRENSRRGGIIGAMRRWYPETI